MVCSSIMPSRSDMDDTPSCSSDTAALVVTTTASSEMERCSPPVSPRADASALVDPLSAGHPVEVRTTWELTDLAVQEVMLSHDSEGFFCSIQVCCILPQYFFTVHDSF